jgi:hypothetical protein
MTSAVALALLGLLAACGGRQAADAPPQIWGDAEVRIESRPSPPRTGMNEFLVMVTGERGKPISDLVVSLRTDDQDAWKQAIQDGQVGVYRRAAEVAPGTRSVLQVQIRRGDTESVLRFPLQLEPQ